MNLKENIDKMRSFFNEKASTDNYDCVHLKMMSNKIAITEALPDGTKKSLISASAQDLSLYLCLNVSPMHM